MKSLMKLSPKCFPIMFTLVVTMAMGQTQVSTGFSSFGSYGGGPFDSVNLGNLNVHFVIPVLHKAGRGMPFNFDLTYDSSFWTTTTNNGVTQWTPVGWGWRSSAQFGSITYSETATTCYYYV